MKNFNLIKYTNWWLGISAALVVGSIVAIAAFGLNYGIDFTGGSLLELKVENTSVDELRHTVQSTGHEAVVQTGDANDYFLRLAPLTEEEHQAILSALTAAYPSTTELRFDSVGPTVGQELKRASLTALAIILLLISLYVAWAFRQVSEPVASWKYGAVTALTAFLHDVVLPLGAFAVLGKFWGYQIDTAFVAAVLTVLGYSINDKIVVFDRIRENLRRHRHADRSFAEIVNQSTLETMGRSINTSLATLFPLAAIFLIGGESTRPFVLVLIIGILTGAYSSIFVASPLLVLWEKFSHKKQ